VSIAIILVGVVLLVGVVVVAVGRGGELYRDTGDDPVAADFESWADVASYRPPAALLGYHARVTERALQLISRSIAERDAEIAWLRGRLRELQPEGEREDGALVGQAESAGAEPQPVPGSLPAPDPLAQASHASRVADEG
jgi:hypothetical protein